MDFPLIKPRAENPTSLALSLCHIYPLRRKYCNGSILQRAKEHVAAATKRRKVALWAHFSTLVLLSRSYSPKYQSVWSIWMQLKNLLKWVMSDYNCWLDHIFYCIKQVITFFRNSSAKYGLNDHHTKKSVTPTNSYKSYAIDKQ